MPLKQIGIALAILALAACDPVCSSRPPAPTGTQHLVFTGPQAGTITDAKTNCTHYPDQKQVNFFIGSVLNNQQLGMTIQINGYDSPRTYPVGSLLDGAGEVRLQVGTFDASSTTGAGTVTVDSDGKSGSLKVDLLNGEHVEGTFRCEKVDTG